MSSMVIEIELARVGDATIAPDVILVLPRPINGEITTRDNRTFKVPDIDAIIAATHGRKLDIVIDYDHASELLAPKGQPAPAAGWIKELVNRAGEVWARVEWTAEGAKAVLSGAWRYISPAFRVDKDKNILLITSAALVNQPALFMTALTHEQESEHDATTAEESKIATMLNLSPARFAALKGEAAADEREQAALEALSTSDQKLCRVLGISPGELLRRGKDSANE